MTYAPISFFLVPGWYLRKPALGKAAGVIGAPIALQFRLFQRSGEFDEPRSFGFTH